MKQTLLTWWQGRLPRERQMLLVLGALVSVMLVWLIVLQPLANAVESGRKRHGSLVIALQDVKLAAADVIRATSTKPTPADGRMVRDVVIASAASSGLDFASTQPLDGGGVTVSIAAVKPTFLLGWLAKMQQSAGVVAGSVTMQKNDDATVSAQISFPGGAS